MPSWYALSRRTCSNFGREDFGNEDFGGTELRRRLSIVIFSGTVLLAKGRAGEDECVHECTNA
jgi:hypothetical protein